MRSTRASDISPAMLLGSILHSIHLLFVSATVAAGGAGVSSQPNELRGDQKAATQANTAPAAEPAQLVRAAGTSGIRAASPADLKIFSEMSRNFRGSSLRATVEKRVKLALVGQERKSSGQIQISRGQIRLELEGDERSLLIVNRKTLYAVNLPPKELPNAPVQVVRASLGSKGATGRGLLALLSRGGFESTFAVSGVSAPPSADSAEDRTYFLQPKSDLREIARAEATVSAKTCQLVQLRYWDRLGNETSFRLSDLRSKQRIPDSTFQYKVPADAEILTE